MKLAKSDDVQVGKILSNQLGKDFLFLHPEVLTESCLTNNKNLLTLNNKIQYNTFHTLIVPSMQTISTANLEKILVFYKNGGRVIFTTQLPTKSAEVGGNARVEDMMAELLPQQNRDNGTCNSNKLGGEVWFVADPTAATLSAAMHRSDAFDVEFPEGVTPLRYIHKDNNGRSVYYMGNVENKPFNSMVAVRGKKQFELWNPHTGLSLPVETEYTKKGKDRVTLVKLTVDPLRSVFLVEK